MMKKIIIVSLVFIISCMQSFGQVQTEKIVMSTRLEIAVPAGFTAFSMERRASSFPGVLPTPLWMISYENGKVMASGTATGKRVDDTSGCYERF
jgi:hypothetical protein